MKMRSHTLLLLLTSSLLIAACSNGQNKTKLTTLSPKEFATQSVQADAVILDVRTPGEFSKGHLTNAVNIDWNDDDFDAGTEHIDKSKSIYVYCLSGSRSAAAADHMRDRGFNNVYELDGGIMKWRAAGLSETTSNAVKNSGITIQQYNDMLSTDKLVLVDFYAEWCAPCKKMKPYIDKLSVEMKDKVNVIRIDADSNPSLTTSLKVDGLPTLFIYKNQQIIWTHTGYISEEELKQQLK